MPNTRSGSAQQAPLSGVRRTLMFLVLAILVALTEGFHSSTSIRPRPSNAHPSFLVGKVTNARPPKHILSSKIQPQQPSALYEQTGTTSSEEDAAVQDEAAIETETTQSFSKENKASGIAVTIDKSEDSIKNMLKFAIPALGIYLSNPMLSNIDNAFVGRTAGVAGLAALSPATICTDQMLYLFSFLGRATTGLVSRAYGVTKGSQKGNVEAAQQAASAPLTMALAIGVCLSIFYAFFTSNLLAALKVDPLIRPQAASYIHWRGAIAWAALAQSVALSTLMATRDSLTPLKIIGLSAALNVVGDFGLCVWPFQLGCSGAAAATAAATVLSSGFMMRGLKRKGILPKIRVPSRKELKGLLEFTGPLMLITLTRLGGFICMQKRASTLGVSPLAAYQLAINMMMFFVLFGEPISQLSQTKLPASIDANDKDSVVSTFKSVLKLGTITSLSVATLSSLALFFGAPFFTDDVVVQGLAQQISPTLFFTVLATVAGIAMDGAMLASRDFGFILSVGMSSFLAQIWLLPRCHSISAIFGTYTMRLALYAVACLGRLALGHGALGRLLRKRDNDPVTLETASSPLPT